MLILGETGVGKEVAARLIHRNSARQSRALVALNCSGIPETLLESELFGHTRGSFTGAYRDKPGVIRQAEGGSPDGETTRTCIKRMPGVWPTVAQNVTK